MGNQRDIENGREPHGEEAQTGYVGTHAHGRRNAPANKPATRAAEAATGSTIAASTCSAADPARTSATASTSSRAHAAASTRTKAASSLARAVALFFGLFSIANSIGAVTGHAATQAAWWIDFKLQFIPEPACSTAIVVLQLLCGIALVARGARPEQVRNAKFAAAASAVLALLALKDAFVYWSLLAQGTLYRALPVPLSAVIAACMLLVLASCLRSLKRCSSTGAAVSSSTSTAAPRSRRKLAATIIWLVVIAMVFPVAQTVFFGSTDYRQHADVAVSFGAKVRSDGSLSLTLQERVKSAAQLYLDGYVDYVLVSGGKGADEPINEAYAMRDYAISLGVPESAIIVDTEGDTTEDTVENSIRICEERGLATILADSSFYHMPRIKMMYTANDVNVRTVPAPGSFTWGSTKAVLREIPAWWFYWAKYCLI